MYGLSRWSNSFILHIIKFWFGTVIWSAQNSTIFFLQNNHCLTKCPLHLHSPWSTLNRFTILKIYSEHIRVYVDAPCIRPGRSHFPWILANHYLRHLNFIYNQIEYKLRVRVPCFENLRTCSMSIRLLYYLVFF